MIIYENDKYGFIKEVRENKISQTIINNFKKLGILGGSHSEINSWINSMQFITNIIDSDEIDKSAYVAIEYRIPLSKKRIDFLICGEDENLEKNFVIVELKQWSKTYISNKEDFVITYLGKGNREVLHPSYQAMQYLYLINSFVANVIKENLNGFSCAYLHNADIKNNRNLVDIHNFSYINDFPIYFNNNFNLLQSKIVSLVKIGNGKRILNLIDKSEFRAPKKLIYSIANILKDKQEYQLIDSQKIVFENVMSNKDNNDNCFLINGNPGTGKSVVAINLLSKLLKNNKKVLFVAPNAAYRNVIKKTITNKENKLIIDNLFSGSSCLFSVDKNQYDWIIVDEAHRLKEKAYMYKGKNQIIDILNCSKNAVFFIDENQKIRIDDIGTNDNIINLSISMNKKVMFGSDYILETQFRCVGANGYINALDTTLQINETANFYLNEDGYDIKICDSPHEMEKMLQEKIDIGYTNSKIVSGYAWEWKTKKLSLDELVFNKDIKIPEHNYEIAWNYNDSNMLWAIRDDGVLQAGCIHTCQGLEFDYCGVIIGNDLRIDEFGNLYGDYNNYHDKSGKKGLKNNHKELSKLIKNIYKVLLSRGQKGSFIFIRDLEVKKYFLKHILVK